QRALTAPPAQATAAAPQPQQAAAGGGSNSWWSMSEQPSADTLGTAAPGGDDFPRIIRSRLRS
ncbi:hypothetical protein, partial [Enterococcus faecium]|uniref:hypothetical protein n=1 Tax=Enterococcus faecium TaxID=1352 RepID=UPI003F42A3FC